MTSVIHATEESFAKDVLESQVPVLVDFWAEWCGPCKSLGTTLEAVHTAKNGTFKLAKVNIEESQSLAARFAVSSIPMILLFKDGQIVESAVGNMPRAKVEAFLRKAGV